MTDTRSLMHEQILDRIYDKYIAPAENERDLLDARTQMLTPEQVSFLKKAVRTWRTHADDLGAKAHDLREELSRAKEEIADLKRSARLREEDIALGLARHSGTDGMKFWKRWALFVWLVIVVVELRGPLLSRVCG